MRLSVEINEKHFLILVGLLAVISVIGIAMGQTGPDYAGHGVEDIGPGTFAGGGDYVFPTGTKVKFGDSGEVSMYYDGTDFIIEG